MKSTARHWTLEDTRILVALAKEGWPASVIILKLQRPMSDVLAKLMDLGLTTPIEP
jgi:hypothetical protein